MALIGTGLPKATSRGTEARWAQARAQLFTPPAKGLGMWPGSKGRLASQVSWLIQVSLGEAKGTWYIGHSPAEWDLPSLPPSTPPFS